MLTRRFSAIPLAFHETRIGRGAQRTRLIKFIGTISILFFGRIAESIYPKAGQRPDAFPCQNSRKPIWAHLSNSKCKRMLSEAIHFQLQVAE